MSGGCYHGATYRSPTWRGRHSSPLTNNEQTMTDVYKEETLNKSVIYIFLLTELYCTAFLSHQVVFPIGVTQQCNIVRPQEGLYRHIRCATYSLPSRWNEVKLGDHVGINNRKNNQCIHACMFVSMYVYMYVCMSMYMYVCMYVICMYVIYVCVCMYVCICMNVYMYV